MKDFTAPYRLVRNGSVGGILVYVRKDTPSKLLALYFLNVECFSVEINLRKWNVLLLYEKKKFCNPQNSWLENSRSAKY